MLIVKFIKSALYIQFFFNKKIVIETLSTGMTHEKKKEKKNSPKVKLENMQAKSLVSSGH